MADVFAVKVCNPGIQFIATWKRGTLAKAETVVSKNITESSFTAACKLLPVGTQLDQKANTVFNFANLNTTIIYKYLIDIQMLYPEISINYNGTKLPRLSLADWLQKHQIITYYTFKYKKLQIIVFRKTEGLMKRFSLINGN